MTDRIRERIATLETQLRDVTARRDEARGALQQLEIAIHQIQGALAVLRELVEAAPEEPMA
jgi:predicted  nucleic acid-binding Zn-ribbon protein